MAIRFLSSKLILTFLIGMIGIIGLGSCLKGNAQNRDIPTVLNPCIPSPPVARSEVVGTTQNGGKTYYLLEAYDAGNNPPSDLIIAVEGNRCQDVFFNPMGDRLPFASAVNRDVARQLTLAGYRREIGRVGRDEIIRRTNEWASQEGQLRLFDEEAWALQQLGIKLPANVVVD